jgi:hypothetical protein
MAACTGPASQKWEIGQVSGGVAESAPPPSDAALTHGETRVLHYLPTILSAREIAGELYLSVNTVKTQQHLYQKSARAAVPRPSSSQRPRPARTIPLAGADRRIGA